MRAHLLSHGNVCNFSLPRRVNLSEILDSLLIDIRLPEGS